MSGEDQSGRPSKWKVLKEFSLSLWSRSPNLSADLRSLAVIVSAILSYVLVTFMIAFDHRHRENLSVLFGIYCLDIIYTLDSVFRFLRIKKSLSHILHPPLKLKLKKYYPSLLDLFSVLPLEIFVLIVSFEYVENDYTYLFVFSILKTNRLIRLYRIPVFYARKTRELRLNLYTREVFAIVVCFLSFLVILFHGIACVWFRLRCSAIISNAPPVCHKLGESGGLQTTANEIDNSHPYYRHLDSNSADSFGWYVGGLHWSVMSLRNSGNRFLLPKNPVQMMTSISIQLFGFGMCAAILLVSIYVTTQMDLRRNIFFHESYGARSFVKHLNMGQGITSFLNESFNYMWHGNRAYTDHNMKPLLPKDLKTQICMCIFQPMVNASEILQCLDRSQLETLSLEIHYRHYFANEFLIRPGTLGYNMYYVSTGTVDVMSEEDPKVPMLTMNRGSLIAELNAIFPTMRRNGVKTQTPCDIIKLNFARITEVARTKPGALDQMNKILADRMYWMTVQEEAKRIKDEADIQVANALSVEGSKLRVDGSGSDTDSANEEDLDEEGPDREIKRRYTIAHNIKEWRKRRAVERKYFTGAQFMSVLAWVKFYKENDKKTIQRNKQFAEFYYQMHKNFRNPASTSMYKVIQARYLPDFVWDRLVISKRTLLYFIWDSYILCLIVFYTLMFPYELVMAKPSFCTTINTVVEVSYYLDVVFRLFIFFEPEEMAPVASVLSHILLEFRRVDICYDIIAVLPLHHIAAPLETHSYTHYLFFRLHMVIFKFVKLCKRIRRWENDVTSYPTLLRLTKHAIFISIFIFWIASIFCEFGCPNYPDCRNSGSEKTWVDKFFDTEKLNMNTEVEQSNFPYAFPLALYWAVAVTFGIGFTEDINPSTQGETTWQTIGLLLGFVMVTYFCADLASSLGGSSDNKSHHEDKAIWLDRYMDDALIELKLIERVNHYLKVQWQILRGISADTTQSIGFLTVSHTMYTELVVHIVAEPLFKTYFFSNMDSDLARKFCLAARLVVIPPNEVVILAGDLIRRMYIIRRGHMGVYFGETNVRLDVLTSGKSFGEVNMIYGVPSTVTVRTLTYVETIVIDQSAFELFLPMSKIHGDEFNKLRQRPERLQKFQESIDVPEPPSGAKTQRKYTSIPKDTNQLRMYKRRATGAGEPPVFEPTYYEQFGYFQVFRYLTLPFTILPSATFVKLWELFRLLSALAVLFFVPLVEAFPHLKRDYGAYILILDAIGIFDMIIRSHAAFYNPKTSELMTHPFLSAKNYFSSGFLADFIGSLPVYLIIDASFSASPLNSTLLAYLFRLNRLIIIYRVLGFIVYEDQKLLNRQSVWRVLKLFMIFLLHAHIMACVTAVLACHATMDELENDRPRCKPNSWIMRGKHPVASTPDLLSEFRIYTFAFYYVVTTSVGCGFADFRPANEIERAYTAFLFFLYIFIITYGLAFMSGSKSHKDYKLLHYKQHMDYLVGYLGREKLESKLTSRIIRYYEYQWTRTKGIEPQKLFSNLLPSLRKEVSMYIFEDVFNQIPILQNMPMGFLRALCVSLNPLYFLRHDYIVKREDVCDTIYFIFRGRVAITNVRNDEEQLDEGGIIGVLDPAVYNPIYEVTAIAITNVDVFTMRRKDFVRVLNGFPTIIHRFKTRDEHIPQEVEGGEGYRRGRSGGGGSGGSSSGGSSAVGSRRSQGLSPTPSLIGQQNSLHSLDISADMDEIRQTLSQVVALVIEEEKEETETKYDEDKLYAQSILPESKVFKSLSIAVFLAAVLSSTLVAYQFAFRGYYYTLFAIGYLVDIIFIVKMGLSFRVSFVDEMGEIVTDFTDIENKYISDPLGFALDFLSTFPLEIFALPILLLENSFARGNFLWAAFRLNRLLRLIHVWFYFAKKSGGFIVKLVRLKLIRLVVYTAVYFHMCACILHGVTAYATYARVCDCNPISSDYNGCKPNGTINLAPEAWFHTKSYEEIEETHTFCSPYPMTLYFIITTFTTTAYGDIYAVTPFEMYFISFVAVSSKIWLGLVLADILSGIQDNTNLSFHLAADGVLKLYSDYGVSGPVVGKTIKYFTYAWVQNRGILYPDFLRRAPACLRMDICLTIYGEHFRKSYLFRDLSESFVRVATTKLRHEWVLQSDYVIRQHETDNKIYFVHKGVVEYTKDIVHPDGQRTSIQGVFYTSRHFGEANGIIGPQPHEYSYKAHTNLDIVSLSHTDIEELFQLFPQYRIKILRRFYGRQTGVIPRSADFANLLSHHESLQKGSLKLKNFDY